MIYNLEALLSKEATTSEMFQIFLSAATVSHTRAPTRADLALRLRSPQEAGLSATSPISSFSRFFSVSKGKGSHLMLWCLLAWSTFTHVLVRLAVP